MKIKVAILSLGILLLTFTSSLLYYGNLIVVNDLESLTTDTDDVTSSDTSDLQYSLPLSDNYDAGGGSLNDFMERQGVLEDLILINERLNSVETFKYIQISQPTVYFLSTYSGPSSTICGGDEYRNQNDGGNSFITSLNTIEGSEFVFKQIVGNLESGTSFTSSDYNLTYNEVIPVILGNDYANFVSVGDTFEVQYYLKKIKVKVIGIFEDDVNLYLPSYGMNLDGYMMFPDIKIDETTQESYYHNTIMMLEKNEGFIAVESLEDLDDTIEIIENISQEFNFAYNIQSIESTYQYLQETERETNSNYYVSNDDNTSIINSFSKKQNILLKSLLFLSLGLIGCGLWLWCKGIKLNTAERPIIQKTKEILKLASVILIVYMASYFLMLNVMGLLYSNFTAESIYYPHGIVRFCLLIVIAITGIVICKKLNKNKGDKTNNVFSND